MITGIEITIDLFWILYLVGMCLVIGSNAQFAQGYSVVFNGRMPTKVESLRLILWSTMWWVFPILYLIDRVRLRRYVRNES